MPCKSKKECGKKCEEKEKMSRGDKVMIIAEGMKKAAKKKGK